MRLFSKKNVGMGAAIAVFGWILYFWNLDTPLKLNFDEFHYVPATKALLEGLRNQVWEHPPFGKILIGIGIALFGDNPIGWRFMSTVFGALSLAVFWFWALALFRNSRTALLATCFFLLCFLSYVHARIAMIDPFMVGFLLVALLALQLLYRSDLNAKERKRALVACGLGFGLSIAVKWFSIVPWVSVLGLIALARLKRALTKSKPSSLQAFAFEDFSWKRLALALVALPVAVYFITFLPLLFVKENPPTLLGLITLQKDIYEGQLRVVSTHPYMSQWWQWPTLIRPIWYAFDKETLPNGVEIVRPVFCVGNPLLMWGGLIALLYCVWDWLKRKSRTAFVIVACYGVFYFSWILIPRKVSFYYYYYPAAITLCLAMAHFLENAIPAHLRGMFELFMVFACLILFVYFYPVLSGIPTPISEYPKWMWFRSWI